MKHAIKNRYTGEIIFECDVPDDLDSGLHTRYVLEQAYLSGADLRGASLRGSYLRGADLRGADLRGSDLRDADLRGSDLSGSYLRGADLRGSYLRGADLRGSDLRDADLRGSDLSGASLRDADLSGASLRDAKGSDYAIAQTRILPDGDLIGWKKCKDDVIVKLRIPESAKRSHAFGRKCRAEYADVLEVFGGEFGIAQYDGKTEYRVGERVYPDSFSENWQDECAPGIHFFITRIEAENY